MPNPSLSLWFLQESPQAPAEAPAAPGFLAGPWVPILLVLVIFYFVLILPERKKQKQRQQMLSALKKGDRVMTSSGIYGTVVQASNEVVVLQVADGVRMRFARAAIQAVIPEETELPAEDKVASKA